MAGKATEIEYVTMAKACRARGVSYSVIQRAVTHGLVRVRLEPGRAPRYRLEDVLAIELHKPMPPRSRTAKVSTVGA